MNYVQFEAKLGTCITWLEFYILCFAISESWLSVTTPEIHPISLYEQLDTKVSVSRTVYSKLITRDCCMQEYCNRWAKLSINIEIEGLRKALLNIYAYTMPTKLQDFQHRLLLSAIVANKDLYRWKVVNSNRCYFCNTQLETIIHLMYDCNVIQDFWEQVRNWIVNNLRLNDTLDINHYNVIVNEIYPHT